MIANLVGLALMLLASGVVLYFLYKDGDKK